MVLWSFILLRNTTFNLSKWIFFVDPVLLEAENGFSTTHTLVASLSGLCLLHLLIEYTSVDS